MRNIKGLRIKFCDPLGSAHKAGGVNRLVGGNKNNGFGFCLNSGIENILSAKDIGHRARAAIFFNNRHMLEGGRMQHNFRFVNLKQLQQMLLIANIGERRNDQVAMTLFAHFQINLIEIKFSIIDENET